MLRRSCIDAFCGAGGLSLGLTRAGFDVALGFDNDSKAIETHDANLPGRATTLDASTVTGSEVLELAGIEGELDLWAGGPPCQGFSKQKRGAHLGDPRNRLVLEYLRLVAEIQPRAFLLENVPMMAQTRGRHMLDEFAQLDNYTMNGSYYVAANYGVAQTRERFMLVGIRDDVPATFTPPVPATPTWPTIRDAIGDLPEPPADYSEEIPNHQRARVTARNIFRFSFVPEGGGWIDIPFEHRLACHQKADTTRGGWPDVYGRLSWNGQCPTITGGFDSFTRGRYGHPGSDRPLTPREAARLQGFPDEFVFLGTRHQVRHQIGNAVPVSLATAVGRSILDALEAADDESSRCGTPPDSRQLSLID